MLNIDTTSICWIARGARGPLMSRAEQPHKWERHHTLTQNFKAMGPLTYKVFNLHFSIRYGTYNSHLHTTISPSAHTYASTAVVSAHNGIRHFSIRCGTYNLHLHTTISPSAHTYVCTAVVSAHNGIRRLNTLCQEDFRHKESVELFIKPRLWYNCWVMRGARGPPTSWPEQPHKCERCQTLTQNLKAMSLWVLSLIKCLTSTLLSDVGHITHTCTQQY